VIHIEITAAGRVKERHYADACAEYIKRLSPYARVTVVEQPEGKPLTLPDGRAYTVALCIEGETLTSQGFGELVWGLADGGQPRIRFLIGGSDGLYAEDKARADRKLSLSPMTFTHAMARVLLLEQLYRAAMIRAGTKYHK
jgi:23S rRNA (pseudouridine1915-N3)-methyltransferase